MANRIFKASLFAALVFFAVASVKAGEVWTYPAHEGEGIENAYSITVDGKKVDVYRAPDQEKDSGEYYFASFDFKGTVKIEITAPFDLSKTQVAPERFGVKTLEQTEKTLTLEADKPFQISIEPNKRVKPLILFGLAPETDAPNEGDANVVYFGAGVHKPDVINLTDNQTLYIAPGAVVYAGVKAVGKNITIRGRGVLAGDAWKRFAGPCGFSVHCVDSDNVTVRDIIIRSPWSWTCTFWNCQNVTIDGLRIVASNMINDDAVDLCNTRNVVVKNCFLRSQDDSIAVKGEYPNTYPCENIAVEDCVFWTDRANIFRIGYECVADYFKNITAKNIDVLHYSVNSNTPNDYWANTIIWLQPNQEMPMSDCHFDDIRVRTDGIDTIMLCAKPMSCSYGEFENPTPGKLENCSLSNFTIYGEKENFKGVIHIKGLSEKSCVKGLKLKNIVYFGEKLDENSPNVQIGKEFTEDVSFE